MCERERLGAMSSPGVRTPGLPTLGLPNLLGLALGQGGETPAVHALVSVLLALAICVAASWAARRRGAWLTASAAALLALIAEIEALVR